MKKAGGIIALIAGIFGLIAAVMTLFIGGIGTAFSSSSAASVVSLGWGGIFYTFLIIIFGAMAISSTNKITGKMLVLTSVFGAILGGTLVAIFMLLSLAGGVLAIVGTKPSVPLTKDKKIAWWIVVLIIIVATAAQFRHPDVNTQSPSDALQALNHAQISALEPNSELAELFNLGSQNTDLQRENKLNQIKGQVVQWRLPVYEVQRNGDGYKVQTQATVNLGELQQKLVGTFIYITPRNDADRKLIEALKTGDSIAFKGVIADVTMRNFEIKPAILVDQAPVAEEPAVVEAPAPVTPTSEEAPAASESPMPTTPTPTEAPMTGDTGEKYVQKSPVELCVTDKIEAFRKEKGEEAIVSFDMTQEWEDDCKKEISTNK